MDAFANRKERKFAKTVLESGREWIFGLDCYHLQTRPPNMQRLEKVRGMAERLEQSNAVYEKYRISGTEGN
ncbi:MAG: hypothetical protein LUC50_02850 [Ruminococcus sp.]|nr:hypothetical protein [Ruminococcus sp.]